MLEKLLDGILSWLVLKFPLFDPPQEDHLLDDRPEDIVQGRARKAFGELGAALRIAQRAPSLRDRPDLAALAERWKKTARQRRLFFDARRRIQLFPQSGVALAVLSALGESVEEERELLQSVLERGFMDRVERSAWDKVDLKYYFDAAGLRHGLPSEAELAAQSSLINPPSLPYAQKHDLYGITHLVFHLSDFGLNPSCCLMQHDLQHLQQYLRLALAVCLVEQDHDLTAELVMSRICVGVRGDPLNHEATLALADAQHPSGFIPYPGWTKGSASPDESAEEAEFFAVYHPTIVTLFLIACDMAASPGRRTGGPEGGV